MGTTINMLAIVPPSDLADEIQDIKREVAEKYRSNEALKRPAHITIVPPFELDDSQRAAFVNKLSRAVKRLHPFEMQLDGFGSFEKRVIFIRPVVTDRLKELFSVVEKAYSAVYPHPKKSKPSYGFSPHITIAYRDLSPEMYDAAMREFSDRLYRRTFVIDSVYLMQHNGRQWTNGTRLELASADDTPTLGF